jgi:hypothetical protein
LEPRLCLSSDFGGTIDNPYLPLIPGSSYVYRGADEAGHAVRSRVTVLSETRSITGVTTTVVRERKFNEGSLVEDTQRFYAQDDAGAVWCFGAEARQIRNGAVVGTAGSWQAGVAGARAAVVMAAQPKVGDSYLQSRVDATGQTARVPFATFANCLKTQQTVTSGSSGATEQRFFAPGFGYVMSQPASGAGESLRLAYVNLAPEAFATKVDNPYFPLTPGTTYIYRGVDQGTPRRTRVTVTRDIKPITGVATTVVRVREYEEGKLFEDTLDYYAQDKAGNVWYFGEDSKQYEDGVVVGTDGSWQAGVNGALPGIFMPAQPSVGDTHFKEFAPGLAEDQASVIAINQRHRVPYGTFSDTLVMQDFSALEPDDSETKRYVPGIGFVSEDSSDGEDVENMKLAYIIVDPAP